YAAALDAEDVLQRAFDAQVRKDRVGGGNLERRGFEDAQRNRWIRLRSIADAQSLPEGRDSIVPRAFSHLDRGEVARLRERSTISDDAVVFTLVVLRRPHLIVELPRRRRIVDERGRRDIGQTL